MSPERIQSSKDIRGWLNKGVITPDEAASLFVDLHEKRSLRGSPKVIPAVYEGNDITFSRSSRITESPFKALFDHKNENLHYDIRRDVEEGVRHLVGLPIYAVIAAIDAGIDALGYGISEITEDATFIASRTLRRAKAGWERGKR